jgi:DDE_Tnp_1-associated/Transposase DDE domain
MVTSLLERFAELQDPRDPRGRLYPLPALLGLTLLAILAGQTSLAAIAQFGRLRGRRLGHALGFKNGQMPCANTLSYLFRDLDADHLDRIIGGWLTERRAAGWAHIAIDGKRLCGSRDGDVPGVHLLAAYAPQAAAVIAQMPVEASTNEHKAALRLLGLLPPLAGAVVTADAMFTHADFCEGVLGKQGEYILYAKDNQATLRQDLAATFEAAEGGDFSPASAGPLA